MFTRTLVSYVQSQSEVEQLVLHAAADGLVGDQGPLVVDRLRKSNAEHQDREERSVRYMVAEILLKPVEDASRMRNL